MPYACNFARKTKSETDGAERSTHHERVHNEVVVLEGIESRRRVDPVLARLTKLQCDKDHDLQPEHDIVVRLHGWPQPPQLPLLTLFTCSFYQETPHIRPLKTQCEPLQAPLNKIQYRYKSRGTGNKNPQPKKLQTGCFRCMQQTAAEGV